MKKVEKQEYRKDEQEKEYEKKLNVKMFKM